MVENVYHGRISLTRATQNISDKRLKVRFLAALRRKRGLI
jgi:hypothetical protein